MLTDNYDISTSIYALLNEIRLKDFPSFKTSWDSKLREQHFSFNSTVRKKIRSIAIRLNSDR